MRAPEGVFARGSFSLLEKSFVGASCPHSRLLRRAHQEVRYLPDRKQPAGRRVGGSSKKFIWERANGEPPGLGPGDSDFEYHLPDQFMLPRKG